MLFHSCAFTTGIEADTPALHVFQRPTSSPPLFLDDEAVLPAPVPLPSPVPAVPDPVEPEPAAEPPPKLLMSKSMYITCFLIVL